jgi:hypothetical protein
MTAMIAPVDTDEEILTLPDAARELNRSHVTLWRLVKMGRIQSVQIGRVHGITRSELERFRTLHRPIGRPKRRKPDPPPEPAPPA